MHALLVAGCALVLALEGPRALALLAEDWRGPYPEPAGAESAATAAALASLDLTLALASGVTLAR
jgi:hypothetical protein